MPENLMFGQITLLKDIIFKMVRLAIQFDKMLTNSIINI